MSITPASPRHKTLELKVSDYLKSKGYIVVSDTYHDVFDDGTIRLLSNRTNPTAFNIRTRSDGLAFHKTLSDCDFEFEIKTHDTNGEDVCIEMLPLAIHKMMRLYFAVRCVYIIEDANRIERGFSVWNIPEIRVIFIPDRWTPEQIRFFKGVARHSFSSTQVQEIRTTKGSGDPFVVIDKKVVETLPDWKTVLSVTQRVPA
jgi:hypothetical protein